MPRYRDSRVLDYSSKQIFALVADVPSYPEFLPWCVACRIQEKSNTHIVADLVIGWKLIRESFTSLVQLDPHQAIRVEYKDGPFRYLHNEWKFKSIEEGKRCQVDFMVDFEFRSIILKKIMDPIFTPAVQKMIAAFEKRADDIYAA